MIDIPSLVKNALREGTYLKNYKFKVLNDDGTTDFTIDNDTLVKESVSIDERMASGDTIKFGLCEGSSLEFQYFNHPNITNRRIQAFIDVQYEDENNALQWHEIPMGFYDVTQSSRQASTGIIKVTAYNKLMSRYLDAKATTTIQDIVNNGEDGRESGVSTYYLLNQLLDGYGIDDRTPIQEPMNSFYEDNLYINKNGVIDGNSSDLGSERIDFKLIKENNYIDFTVIVGAFAIQRKSVMATKMIADENGKITGNSEFLPIGYHYVSFNSEIPSIIRNGVKNAFEEFIVEEYENSDYTYYVQPYRNNNLSIVGTKIKLSEFLAMLDDDTENIQALCPTDNNMNGTISHLDSMFKGLVALDNSYINQGAKLGTSARLKRESTDSSYRDYRYFQLITPQNKTSTKLLYVPSNNRADSRACNAIRLVLPSAIYFSDDGDNIESGRTPRNWYAKYAFPWHENGYDFQLECKYKQTTGIENYVFTNAIASGLQDVTARDLQSAVFEMQCQFGQLDRVTDLFSGHELNNAELLPQETLYPHGNISAFKSMYEKLWADEGNIHNWRYLIITYKGLDGNGNEVERKLQRTIDEHGTDNYNCSDNWLFRNLVWTEEQIGAYADAMVQKMRNVTWFPFEMWCAGLPHVETGDKIEVIVGEESYNTYVLQRQLKGIQDLHDTYINGTLDIF